MGPVLYGALVLVTCTLSGGSYFKVVACGVFTDKDQSCIMPFLSLFSIFPPFYAFTLLLFLHILMHSNLLS